MEELFLNDETNINLEKNIEILSRLPALKILHLEHDHLKRLPKNMSSLTHLEVLFLNENEFKHIPDEVYGIKTLMLLDIENNKIKTPIHRDDPESFGFKIKF